MSERFPGGFITKSPVAPTSTAASGIWTLDQQEQYKQAGTWPAQPNYIEEVFSTYLYSGNDQPTQKITNGIDLLGKGGLVWKKARNAGTSHELYDSSSGPAAGYLISNSTAALTARTAPYQLTFASDGYNDDLYNNSAYNFVSWSFRKQPKFFDVVTYTGNGTSQTITHNLGAVPGFIIVKRTDTAANWAVSATSSAGNYSQLYLNTTAAALGSVAQSTYATSTTINVGLMASSGFFSRTETNTSGGTYVAYLFASNAGGFGLAGTDNVISCGSFTTDASKAFTAVNLGYEPQYLLVKRSDSATGGSWLAMDNMRGLSVVGNTFLYPNATTAEAANTVGFVHLNATGFENSSPAQVQASATYIYVAIRRGPMKVPTLGTSVYLPTTPTGGNPQFKNLGFNPDLIIDKDGGPSGTGNYLAGSRLTDQYYLNTATTAAQVSGSPYLNWAYQNGAWDDAFTPGFGWTFGRAPSFFDVVCYTGDGTSGRNITHNLTVSPELVIVKGRSRVDDWVVRSSAFPTHGVNGIAYLNLTTAASNAGYSYAPTTTTFQVDSNFNQNGSGYTYVAYLFATCPGVSKVGSYSGTGATQTINCGFTTGARYVLIKRTDTTGDWYIWDSARGMVAGTDPSLLLNSTAAQVSANSVYTTGVGFQIVSTAAGINASGGTYIFLAIA